MGLIGCSETSVRNYRSSPHNSPGECSSHLLHGGSLKSSVIQIDRKNVRVMTHYVSKYNFNISAFVGFFV
jgi:hypothetical protein